MFYLALAILAEVTGTVFVKLSDGYTRAVPSVLVFVFYGLSLSSLNFALRSIELGSAYAIWCGVGMALIATAGVLWFEEPVTVLKTVSLALIVAGVAGLSLGTGAERWEVAEPTCTSAFRDPRYRIQAPGFGVRHRFRRSSTTGRGCPKTCAPGWISPRCASAPRSWAGRASWSRCPVAARACWRVSRSLASALEGRRCGPLS